MFVFIFFFISIIGIINSLPVKVTKSLRKENLKMKCIIILFFFSFPHIPYTWHGIASQQAVHCTFNPQSITLTANGSWQSQGGFLKASMMILDTMRCTAQRTGGDRSPAILMSIGLKVLCPSLAAVRPSPPSGSPHQSDGSFPTNASRSVTSEDCINPAKALLVFIWLHLMEATQEAMFIFWDQ